MTTFRQLRLNKKVQRMSTKQRLPHGQWASEKERELDRTRKIARRKKIKAKQELSAKKEVADLHFKKWLLRKTNYEKAQTLLHGGINASRAGREEEWKEVGTALAAVDLMLGTYDLSSGQDGSGASLDKENSCVYFGVLISVLLFFPQF